MHMYNKIIILMFYVKRPCFERIGPFRIFRLCQYACTVRIWVRHFTISWKTTHFEFDGRKTSQTLGCVQPKTGNVSGARKKQLKELFSSNLVNKQQVSIMVRYKKTILERQSLSEVKMGRGLSTCKLIIYTHHCGMTSEECSLPYKGRHRHDSVIQINPRARGHSQK